MASAAVLSRLPSEVSGNARQPADETLQRRHRVEHTRAYDAHGWVIGGLVENDVPVKQLLPLRATVRILGRLE